MDFDEEDNNNPFIGSDHYNYSSNIDSYFTNIGGGNDGGNHNVNDNIMHDSIFTNHASNSILNDPYGFNSSVLSSAKVLHDDFEDTGNADLIEREMANNSNNKKNTNTNGGNNSTGNTTGNSTSNGNDNSNGNGNETADSLLGQSSFLNRDNVQWKAKTEIEIVSTEVFNGVTFYIIQIINNNNDNNGRYTRRRYSDFHSLRINLLKFFPTKIIPLIPEKHSFKDIINRSDNRDNLIIDFRKRKFNNFLKYLNNDDDIRSCIIFQKFIDPDERVWLEVLQYAPFTLLPSNLLLSSPSNPTGANPYYSYLSIPPVGSLKSFDSKLNREIFKPLECKFNNLKMELNNLNKISLQIENNLRELVAKKIELGGNFNVFSLFDNNSLVEKIGQSIDSDFINLEIFIKNFIINFKEPLQDLKNQCHVVMNLLTFRKLKEIQLHYFKNTVLKRQNRTKLLIETENSNSKLSIALKKGAEDSPTIAEAVRRLELKKHKKINNNIRDNNYNEEYGTRDFYNPENSSIKRRKNPKWKNLFGSSNNTGELGYAASKNINSMSSAERLNEIVYNIQELGELQKCLTMLTDDLKFLSCEIEKNVLKEYFKIKFKIFELMKIFEKILMIYCKEAKCWPEFYQESSAS